jgi:hypothetical protein
MGYTTHVEGELTISPPLTWNEFKDSPFYALQQYDAQRDLMLRVDETEVDTDGGVLTRRTASALVMAWEDEYRAYNLMDHVQEAVTAFPGHTWSGRLECEGEENTDMWRVVVRDGRAVRVEPRIVWPDEDGE